VASRRVLVGTSGIIDGSRHDLIGLRGEIKGFRRIGGTRLLD
jgi:hypothetical protein